MPYREVKDRAWTYLQTKAEDIYKRMADRVKRVWDRLINNDVLVGVLLMIEALLIAYLIM